VAALLGPNGSGKSTVMRILTGYFSPTAGRARVNGIDVAEQPAAARRQVGYLPEQVSVYPELSVRRYLAFVAEVKGLVGRARRSAVDDVIARCGLAEVANRLAGKLSKGFRQRVGLAQALVGDPDVLILDEPTVGLDPMQTVEMRALLRTLTDRTMLLSTHILSEASALCSRIVILARGHLVAEDTPEGLARRLAGAAQLAVRIDGPPDAVSATLAALPGVTNVLPAVPDGQRGVAFSLLAPDPEPVQRALAAAVVARGWTLLEVRTTVPSLEDLFVRLVGPGRDGS
jgi:ABC-2 type transport system ATP-binding protein